MVSISKYMAQEFNDVILKKVAGSLGLLYDPVDIQVGHRFETRRRDQPPHTIEPVCQQLDKAFVTGSWEKEEATIQGHVGVGDQRV